MNQQTCNDLGSKCYGLLKLQPTLGPELHLTFGCCSLLAHVSGVFDPNAEAMRLRIRMLISMMAARQAEMRKRR